MASKLLTLCCLPFLAVFAVPAEHHAELKKLLDGKSPQEIAALKRGVNAAKAKSGDTEMDSLKQEIELLKSQLAGKKKSPASAPIRSVDNKAAQAELQKRKMSAGEAKTQLLRMEKEMDGIMHPERHIDPTHSASKRHHAYKELTDADYAAQFPDQEETWFSWTISLPWTICGWISWMFSLILNPYLGLCVLAVVGGIWWKGNLAAMSIDMQYVSVPGFGQVKTAKLFGSSKDIYAKSSKLDDDFPQEFGDLLDAQSGYRGYGAGTMTTEPKRNVAECYVLKPGDDGYML